MATIGEILESKGESVSRARDERGRFASAEPPTQTPEPQQAAPAQEPPAEAPKAEAAPAQPTPEQPATAPSGAPTPRDPVKGLEAGIVAERTKRQDAERRAAEMEARIAAQDAEWKRRFDELERRIAPPTQPKAEEAPPIDVNQFWEAPDKYLQTQFGQYQARAQQDMQSVLMQQAEWVMQQRHADYGDVRDVFLTHLVRDPKVQEVFRSKPPHEAVEWAYHEGKRLLEAEEAKWAARIEAKRASASPQPQSVAAPPPSLNAEPSPAAPTPAYQGPRPLGALLRNKL